jgi:hypothetical protein
MPAARRKSDEAGPSRPARQRASGTQTARTGDPGRDDGASRKGRAVRPSAAEVARSAMEQLHELTGRAPEGVVQLSREGEDWTVGVEVVESRRIPDSADILAVYEVRADDRGRLLGYERIRRYARGRGSDD